MAVEYRCCGSGFFSHIAVVTLLVLFAGLMSGLTLGLMSMSLVDLEVLARSGTSNDRKYASNFLFQGSMLLLIYLIISNTYCIACSS